MFSVIAQATNIMGDRMESRCLQSLPNELLLNILGHLPCNFRLTSVTHVCHQFKDLIESMEMKTLELKVTFPEQEILNLEPNERKKHPLYKLLRRFLKQPLDLTSTPWLPPSYDRFRRLFDHLDKHPKRLEEIRSVSLTVEDPSWYTSCFPHHGLLISLPHLEHLTLSPPAPFSACFPVQKLSCGAPALRSLRLDFLPLMSQPVSRGVIKDIHKVIEYYLRWLKLHKLRIDGLDLLRMYFMRHITTVIKDIWCVACRNYEAADTAAQLMGSTTDMVRFVFETNVDHLPRRSFGPPLAPLYFYNCILKHKRTLRQMVISSSDYGVIPTSWTLGPLNMLCQLEKLAVPFSLLPKPTLDKAGYDLLPPKLEELQIEYPFHWEATMFDEEQRLNAVRRHVRNMKSSLPQLKRLIMWDQKNALQMETASGGFFAHVPLETLRMHERAYQKFGVKYEWVTACSFWDTPVGRALDAEGDVIIDKSRDGLSSFPTLHPTSPH